MKRSIITLVAIFALSFILLSSDCEEENGGVATNYFPHADQTTWVFDEVIEDETITMKLNGTENHATAGEVQVLEMTTGGETFYTYIKANDNGVTMYFDLTTDDRWEILRYPIKVGDTWHWDITYNDENPENDEEWHAEVLAEENVSVPAGEFTALKITLSSAGYVDETFWFASGTGWVRDYAEGYYDRQLRSFNQPS